MEHRTRSGESERVRFAPHAERSGDSPDGRRDADSPDGAHAPAPFPETPPATVADALAHAQRIASGLRSPGRGQTERLWEHLATLAAHDLGVARAVEPHLDACAILDQAGLPLPDGAWGVFAAEGGPDPLRATPHETRAATAPPPAPVPVPARATATATEPEWSITGEKLWCSLAAQLDGALVTAATDDGPRLFAVDLRDPGVRVRPDAWAARGLVEIPSGPVTFDRVPAAPVGGPRWYLERDGFWWGGIGVAACWFGGAVAMARTLRDAAAAKPDPHRAAHLGAIDTLLHACGLALRDAADAIDAGRDVDGPLLALRVRGIVARTCEEVITRVGHALGPAPLAMHAEHAKRVSDLQLYVRQHHAERDEAAQGSLLVASEAHPW